MLVFSSLPPPEAKSKFQAQNQPEHYNTWSCVSYSTCFKEFMAVNPYRKILKFRLRGGGGPKINYQSWVHFLDNSGQFLTVDHCDVNPTSNIHCTSCMSILKNVNFVKTKLILRGGGRINPFQESSNFRPSLKFRCFKVWKDSLEINRYCSFVKSLIRFTDIASYKSQVFEF